jgi:hypothetical protein
VIELLAVFVIFLAIAAVCVFSIAYLFFRAGLLAKYGFEPEQQGEVNA